METKIKKGDTIRDCYGKLHKVLEVNQNIIYCYDGEWVHISKVTYHE